MLTYEDCLAYCDMTEEEVQAIAEHEHIPAMAALELADYLVHRPDGTLVIKRMLLDDIEEARAANNLQRYLRLKATLAHFVKTHPENPDNRR